MEQNNELVIERIFGAPVETVWKYWSEPEYLMHWWGPKDFTCPTYEADFRVGGKYLYDMRSNEGKDYWGTGVYKEIVPFEKIVCTDNFADKDGNVVPASYYEMTGDWPNELLVTLTFEEHAGTTKMILRHQGIPAGEMREQAGSGWNESFDKMADDIAMGYREKREMAS